MTSLTIRCRKDPLGSCHQGGTFEQVLAGPLARPTFGNPYRQSALIGLESTFKLTYSPFPDEQP